jgi:small-conductance mechanosensitive channel
MLNLLALENSYALAAGLSRVVFILAAAYAASLLIKRMMRGFHASSVRLMMRHAAGSEGEIEKRAATIAGILQKAGSVLIAGVAMVMVLREVGFDITPILTGVGVAGLAVGFGAQNLVRDVISGFFMLVENQIRINDVAIINGTGGLVEEMNLRTTVLRSQDGAVHIFPNGTINTLSNMTREYSYYVLDIGIAYKEDTDRVTSVLREVAEELGKEPAYSELILAPLEVLGVDRFTDSSVVIKSRIKTLPIRQWMVGRELNRRIKKRFDQLGIEIPFPQRSLHLSDKALNVHFDGPTRVELKQLVHEVLAEWHSSQRSSGAVGPLTDDPTPT